MTEDKILLVARFVEGDMDEAESATFEGRMQNDAELQQHLKDYQSIHQHLKVQLAPDEKDLAFKAQLSEIGRSYFEAPKVVSLTSRLKWLSGVAAVLIVGLLIWAPWRDNLYQAYGAPSQMLVTERGSEKTTNLDQAAAAFNDKKYAEAATLLAKLAQQEPENTMVNYYYALSLIETDQLAQSRTILNSLYTGESIFKYDAAYALAMSYLKVDQKEECKIWLQKIPQGTAPYPKAKALLSEL